MSDENLDKQNSSNEGVNGLLKKYKNLLTTLKENRAETVDINTDEQNHALDREISQVAEFIRDLRQAESEIKSLRERLKYIHKTAVGSLKLIEELKGNLPND